MTPKITSTDALCINTIRALAMDAVEKANSGHPGAPMGMAPMAYVLWSRFLKVNPKNPSWANRDRFVLSAGHASMLMYALLHLTGYDLSLEDLKNFRQWGSRTPGHPEFGHTPGVETTTGPLGQGFATAVGMAVAERSLAKQFNRPGHDIVDHTTYVIASDGDLMEGISYEAASLAGHLKLGKLICLYDDNKISIDGKTDLAFTENVAARFEAMGWHVQKISDGDHDWDGIDAAIRKAKAETSRPSIIVIRTTIGYGAPNKKDCADCHGAPLGAEEVKFTKKVLEWPEDAMFLVPDEAKKEFGKIAPRGESEENTWKAAWKKYASAHPELAKQFESFTSRNLPSGWESKLPPYEKGGKAVATRNASGDVLNALKDVLGNLVSGSADLSGSVMTMLKGAPAISAQEPAGRNFHYGVREHAMGAIVNGMMLHGGMIAAAGTFLIFSDYMKPSIRLAALMGIPSIFLFSHDSVGLGEDGPTHQPVEQLEGLRAIPNLHVIRPADANETVAGWKSALERKDGPTVLVLSRQKLPIVADIKTAVEGVNKGAYVLSAEAKAGKPDLILIATGSEIALALEAQANLQKSGHSIRVVSVPCREIFIKQSESYRESVLPSACRKRISIEAASTEGWHRFVGLDGTAIGIDRFGASAPGEVALDKFGFNVKNVVDHASKLLARK